MSRSNTSEGAHYFEPLPTDSPPSYSEIMSVPPHQHWPQQNLMPMPTAAYPGLENASAMPAPSAPELEPNTNPTPAGPVGFVVQEKAIVTSQPMTSFPQSYEHNDKMNLQTSGYQNAAWQRDQTDTSSKDEGGDCVGCCQFTYVCCLCCECVVNCISLIAKCAK